MARRKPPTTHGLAVVDKPAGVTSHDVVGMLRRRFGERQVGHAGTLDPDATGVLLVGVGRCTRLLRFLTDLGKTYAGQVVFGSTTDSLDSTGVVTGTYEMAGLTPEQVRAAERVVLPELPFDFRDIQRVTIAACGTAYYAGMVGKYWFEKLARMPVESDVASELRYRNPVYPRDGVALFVSQSGETADTLAALRDAKAKGQTTIAVVNVAESSIAREADIVLPTYAGPEIGVASTKAFTCQLSVLASLAVAAGRARGVLSEADEARMVAALGDLPGLVLRTLRLEPGDLQIFKGRYSLHRVTPLVGQRLRYVAIFSYVEEPGMVAQPERARQLYGRVLPIHLERAGLRAPHPAGHRRVEHREPLLLGSGRFDLELGPAAVHGLGHAAHGVDFFDDGPGLVGHFLGQLFHHVRACPWINHASNMGFFLQNELGISSNTA